MNLARTNLQILGSGRHRSAQTFVPTELSRLKAKRTSEASSIQHPASSIRSRRAFTLIEIMIVVAILGLVLTMGFPSIVRAFEKQGMTKAVYEMCQALSDARSHAIITGKPAKLTFHPKEHTFQADGGQLCTLPDNVAIELLGVNFIQLEDADVAEVTFQDNGTCDEFTIVLRSDTPEWRKISLDVVTARATVEEIR